MRLIHLTFMSLLALGCGSPHPKTPEAVKAHEEQKRPTRIVDHLSLSVHQEQKLDELIERTRVALADYEVARKALLQEAIVQVRAGLLRRDKLEPLALDAIEEFDRALPAIVAVVDELHETLSQEQRQRFVDLMQGEDKDKTDEQRRAARHERIGRVLDLTAGQKTRLYPGLLTVVVDHWGAVNGTRSALNQAYDEFVEEDFDAAEQRIVTELDLKAIGEAAFDALRLALGVLTPEQHRTLAAWMEAKGR